MDIINPAAVMTLPVFSTAKQTAARSDQPSRRNSRTFHRSVELLRSDLRNSQDRLRHISHAVLRTSGFECDGSVSNSKYVILYVQTYVRTHP